MAGEQLMTVYGNLTDDPELRFTPSGAAVANFTVASTASKYDRQTQGFVDADKLFMRCAVWRQQAEHVAESLQKGMRVVVVGTLKTRQWEDRDGGKRSSIEMDVLEIGAALRFATAKVTKATRSGGDGGQQGGGGWGNSGGDGGHGAQRDGGDPWGVPAGGSQTEEPPF